MADEDKLAQIQLRISDLGAMLAEVEASQHPLAVMLFRRLWAVREIVLGEHDQAEVRNG